MIKVAVRISELVSSNVDSMVGKASNPEKMLRHLCTEIEESLVSLHGELSKATRRHERFRDEAGKLAAEAEEWTAKARIAVDHKREDLARSALLAREDGRRKAEARKADAAQAREEADGLAETIAKLEARRREARERLKALPVESESGRTQDRGSDTLGERHLDRIDRIERRVGFVTDESAEPAPASVEAEIAALQREADIVGELAAMKAAARPPKSGRKTAK